MTSYSELEANRPMRAWRVTYADGTRRIVNAKSSYEAVQASKVLYHMAVQKVEDSYK
jgi:hypothetical protein